MQCQRNSNSKQLTGPWAHRTGPWTHRELNPPRGGGGGVRIKWLNHLKGTFRCDKSLRHQNDCPQYIPKGKQTPASKLAFVTKINYKKNVLLMVPSSSFQICTAHSFFSFSASVSLFIPFIFFSDIHCPLSIRSLDFCLCVYVLRIFLFDHDGNNGSWGTF